MAGEAAAHCPTCGATWGHIAAYQCDGPGDAPHPRVRTVPGPPPAPRPERAVVTQAEVQAARDLLADYGMARPSLAAAIAAALADAREGATIPGVRMEVEQYLDVSVRAWQVAEHLNTHQATLRGKVRRAWAAHLEAHGLRPLGWPPVTITYLCWAEYGSLEYPFTEVPDLEGAHLVRLSVRGPAVAL